MSTQKKILFLTHVGNMGGAEAKMISLAKSVANNSEICMFQNGELKDPLQKASLKYSVLEMPSSITSFKREQGLFSALKIIPGMFSFIRMLSRKSRDFDVIVCMSQKSFVFSALAKPITRKPIVWFMNDLITKEHFSGSLIKFLTTLSRFTANHIVLNSQASQKAWLDAGGKKKNIHVLYSGVDTNNFEKEIQNPEEIKTIKKRYVKNDSPLIGIFGRISNWKGQDVFLKALSKINEAHGIIVGGAQFGEEEYEKKLHKLTAELGIGNRITFVGHSNEIPKLMAACDVITHCSTSPEPFGRVIVEAMLAKTPVIASDAGGAQEIIEHGDSGYLFPMGNSDKLIEYINICLTKGEKDKAIQIDKANHRAKKYFSSQIMLEKFSKIIQTSS